MCERERVKALNDFFRTNWCETAELGKVVLTRSLCEFPRDKLQEVLSRVVHYDEFTPDDDPYGLHDFGSFTQDGEKLFWMIDYYNRDMSAGSDNPADPKQTMRVLTIMLASEY